MATPTTNYFIVQDPSWSLLQLQNVYLKYDTSVTNAAVRLPQLSTVVGKDVQIQITNVGGGALTVFPFSQAGPPSIQDTISGGIAFQFTKETYTLKIKQIDGVAVEWEIEEPVSISVAALNQAGLATPTYVNYPIGFVVYVLDYNATGKGCSIQKTSVANGDYQDWIVTATENTFDTGGFGLNPI
jgi:hypothetical protein